MCVCFAHNVVEVKSSNVRHVNTYLVLQNHKYNRIQHAYFWDLQEIFRVKTERVAFVSSKPSLCEAKTWFVILG